ncbi:MAG: hypothetical protein QM770_22955 [Tepidisphaeraceae bacterium]
MRSARAFTLIELLVVVGIVIVLISILTPTIMSALKSGDRARTAMQIQTIATALDAYKSKFSGLPPSNTPHAFNSAGGGSVTDYSQCGAYVLARALVGNGKAGTDGDGVDGPGYRLPSRTGVSGEGEKVDAILQPGAVKLAKILPTMTPSGLTTDEDYWWVIVDPAGTPYYYYTKQNPLTLPANGFMRNGVYNAATNPYLYNGDDNLRVAMPGGATAPSLGLLQFTLGDTNMNGVIDAGETPVTTADYLIISPGPQKIYPSIAGLSGDNCVPRSTSRPSSRTTSSKAQVELLRDRHAERSEAFGAGRASSDFARRQTLRRAQGDDQ